MAFVRSVETTHDPVLPSALACHPERIAAIINDFDARVVAVRDDGDVVVVSGELDAATAPRLQEIVLAGHDLNTALTLDMEGVTFMDVAGLTVLENIGLLVQAAYGPMSLRRPSRAVRYLLDFRRRFAAGEPWVVQTEGIAV